MARTELVAGSRAERNPTLAAACRHRGPGVAFPSSPWSHSPAARQAASLKLRRANWRWSAAATGPTPWLPHQLVNG